MKTAIVIPSKTAALLAGCLGALRMTTPGLLTGEVGICVIGNGTPDERRNLDTLVRETRAYLPKEAVIVLEEVPYDFTAFYGNLCHEGACWGRNNGAQEIVFLNDDTYPTPGWLENLRIDMGNLQKADKNPGLLGCRGCNVSGPQNIFDPTELAMRQRVHWKKPEKWMEPVPCVFVFPRIVTFACMVLTEAYFKAGGFDLNLPAHNYSDDILSYRLLKAGHHNWISGSFVAHLGSRTVAAAGTLEVAQEKYEADLTAGLAYYKKTCPDAEAVALGEMKWAGIGEEPQR